MDDNQLVLFIENRREEQKRCIDASNYIEQLYNDFQFTNDDDYKKIKQILNRRFFFLEKSIISHSKLLARIEAEKAAEKERIEREKSAAAEQARIKAENEKLRIEAAKREEETGDS